MSEFADRLVAEVKSRQTPFPDRMKAYIKKSLTDLGRGEADFKREMFEGSPSYPKYPSVDKILEEIVAQDEVLPAEVLDAFTKKVGGKRRKTRKSTRRQRQTRRR